MDKVAQRVAIVMVLASMFWGGYALNSWKAAMAFFFTGIFLTFLVSEMMDAIKEKKK